jgi:hypothetical protein
MIILPGYSEFNRLIESVLFSDGNEVISLNGFECIFDKFNKIHSFKNQSEENVFELFHKVIDYQNLVKKNDFTLYKSKYSDFLKKIFKENYLDLQPFLMEHYPNYDFFKDICRDFFINNFIIKPYKKDYDFYKEKYANKKVVCINGRNTLYKHNARNNLLLNVIKQMISNDFYVINTTMMPPRFDLKNYEEIQHNLSYNEMVALYDISHCVISIQNAGGISTHLLTEANFILLDSSESWVNNKKFGFNNKTQVELRKEKGYFTEVLNENSIINIIEVIKPNEIKKFSDESKIIYY